jgi:hypothetical protein
VTPSDTVCWRVERSQGRTALATLGSCAFSIFVRVEIVQVFLLTVNAHPRMIHPADS